MARQDKRHKHADLMIAYANNKDLEIEVKYNSGTFWSKTNAPTWDEGMDYRIKPKPHKQQALMELQKANPNTRFEYCWLGEWHLCNAGGTAPNWDLDTEYRINPEEPKLTKMWQWIYRSEYTVNNNPIISTKFFCTQRAAEVWLGTEYTVIGKAPWTEIAVNETTGELV